MYLNYFRFLFVVLCCAAMACGSVKSASKADVETFPTPKKVMPKVAPTPANEQVAVFAGGCFWGVEAVFEHIKGVTSVTSGYAGGKAKTANYEDVGTGKTGHAESVQITFDSSKVSYRQLLEVFFAVAHDPTEFNRQGPDTGTQYRSAIFYTSGEQKQTAENFIAKLTADKIYPKPIVTQITPLEKYYEAEDYHQDYLVNHPDERYIVINDQPKVENLRKTFPDLYR
jgi:peptide-methionine (S)-S-oxide reductase